MKTLFKEQSVIALATVDSNNTPNLRYVEHQFTIGNNIYFATSNQGSAYKDLCTNPNIVIMQLEDGIYNRVKGTVQFLTGTERETIKVKINDSNPKIQARYGVEGFAQYIEVGYIINPEVDSRNMTK